MPINADKIRELAARGEGPTLDFKVEGYSQSANFELAKDIMAIANVLRANAEPGYILIGIDDDGRIVGVDASSHLDDAAVHQKVQGLLNQTPTFVYYAVDVDGSSIGVYEIRGGKRPYFAIKTQGNLRRHEAHYRNGSTTDVASPTMIIEWVREDDPVGHRLRSMELREREADAIPRGRISIKQSVPAADDKILILAVTNVGRRGFTVDEFRWEARWNQEFFSDVSKQGIALSADDVMPPSGLLSPDESFVPEGGETIVRFRWTRAAAVRAIGDYKLGIGGFKPDWADYAFSARIVGDLGEAAQVYLVVE